MVPAVMAFIVMLLFMIFFREPAVGTSRVQ
jgi:hypothetical protein